MGPRGGCWRTVNSLIDIRIITNMNFFTFERVASLKFSSSPSLSLASKARKNLIINPHPPPSLHLPSCHPSSPQTKSPRSLTSKPTALDVFSTQRPPRAPSPRLLHSHSQQKLLLSHLVLLHSLPGETRYRWRCCRRVDEIERRTRWGFRG